MLAQPVVTSPPSSAEGLMIQPLTSMYHVTVDGPVAVPSMDHAPRLLSAYVTITWESGAQLGPQHLATITLPTEGAVQFTFLKIK